MEGLERRCRTGLAGQRSGSPLQGRGQHSGHSEGREKNVPRIFSQLGTALGS